MRSRNIVLCLLSAAPLTLAFPPFRLGFLAYWALIPFLFLLADKEAGAAMRWGVFFGLLSSIMGIFMTGRIGLFSDFYKMMIHALSFALFAVLVLVLRRRWPFGYLLGVPFLWAAIEYGKALINPDYAWLALGYTQNYYLKLMQYTPSIGVYLVSFWVVSLNTILFAMWQRRSEARWLAGLGALLVLVCAVPYTFSRLLAPEPRPLQERQIEVRQFSKVKASVPLRLRFRRYPESATTCATAAAL